MKIYDSKNLRNVAVLGHSGSGKSNLMEMMSHTANINKIAKLSDKEHTTNQLSLNAVEFGDYKYNFLDTPGSFDFSGDVISALSACNTAIIVVDATDPLQVGTEKALELTEGLPKIMFINKIDDEKARYKDVIEMLNDKFPNKIVPMISPIFNDKKFVGLHNIFENVDDLEGEFKEQAIAVKEALMELVAETDDEILDKYFSGEELTKEEILNGLRIGIQRGDIIPVISGSTINNVGTKEMMEAITDYIAPAHLDSDADFRGFVFKTVVDPFIGKMSYIKIVEGSIKKDMEVFNVNKDQKEKVSNIYSVQNSELAEISEAKAGDIVVVTKVNSLKTGDTIAKKKDAEKLPEIKFPRPQIYYAVNPANKNEEEKVGTVLMRLLEEDPTLEYTRNKETKQALLGGQGDIHLKHIKQKMKDKFGLDISFSDLEVAYRETIKGSSDVQGKHKKQSGGRGQYGDVKIRFSHSEEPFEFSEELFGESIPRSYVPAVEKGLQEAMLKGVLAGYPVTNIKAVLYDGSYHDVDSSEMAFKLAASLAFKKGMEDAKPILLEPIMKLTITIPDEYMGDVMGDMTKRRGKILGMDQAAGGKQILEALAPQAETFKYAIDLRSMTQGRGFFEMEFDGYQEVPGNIAEKIIAARK